MGAKAQTKGLLTWKQTGRRTEKQELCVGVRGRCDLGSGWRRDGGSEAR